jgi:hypothetical protein
MMAYLEVVVDDDDSVKFSLCSTKYHAVKTYGGMKV